MTAQHLETVINQQYGELYRQALAILKQPCDAEDAVQTACLKALEHCQELLNETRVGPWFRTIVYRECMTILRHRRRTSVIDPWETSADGPSPDALVGYWQLMDDITAMPQSCRQAFLLRYDHGYSVQSIARMLHLPRSTVSSRLRRARGTLRRQLLIWK